MSSSSVRRPPHSALAVLLTHRAHAESICDNPDVILANIRGVKISSPDVSRNHTFAFTTRSPSPQYRGWDPEKAIEDYYNRIRDHEKHYQPVEETLWPSIRIMNVRAPRPVRHSELPHTDTPHPTPRSGRRENHGQRA